MKRLFFIIMIMVGFMVDGVVLGAEGEIDKFVKITVGYHGQALYVYRENLEWLGNVLSLSMGRTSTDSIEGRVNLGYRRGNFALIAGFGYFDKIRTEWRWPDGGDGYAAFDTYFVDLTARRYLLGSYNSRPKGLVLYGEGGLGLYTTRWRFEDDRISWVLPVCPPKTIHNPRVEGSDLGWHLGGGFECFFTPNFSMDINALYRWIYIENGWRFPDSLSPRDAYHKYSYLFFLNRWDKGLELDLSGISANIGFNLHF